MAGEGKKLFFDLLQKVLATLNRIVWGPGSLVFVVLVGIFMTVKLNFFQFSNFFLMLRETIGKIFIKEKREHSTNSISPVQAVSTALAGTIGTGSITGIAMAIKAGGPGVIFWMCAFSFLGMAVKFSEIVLSLKFREKDEKGQWIGGPMYYIKNGLKFRPLAILFSVFALLCCFGIGNITQSNAISKVIKSTLNFSELFCGVVLMVLVALIIWGGVKRIGKVNEYLVPIMTILYISTSLVILILRFEKVPEAIRLIFSGAFSIKAASGGALGFGFYKAVQYGISRSIFSNEAGLGSAPIAHAASSEKNPVKQGLWGMFEVFFSTVVICTLSGLVILTSSAWNCQGLSGAEVVINAFDSAIPVLGRWVVFIVTIFFAFSSILGWAYYGEVCISYLVKKRRKSLFCFRIIYIIFVFLGAAAEMDLVWNFSETMNGFMMLPNLISVICLSGVVKKECDFYKKERIDIEKF